MGEEQPENVACVTRHGWHRPKIFKPEVHRAAQPYQIVRLHLRYHSIRADFKRAPRSKSQEGLKFGRLRAGSAAQAHVLLGKTEGIKRESERIEMQPCTHKPHSAKERGRSGSG
jgi:hypothetical protein